MVRATVNLVQSLGIRAAADGVDSERLLYQVRSYGVRSCRERSSATR